MKDFEVFKEISIGGLTKEQLLLRLKSANIQFNDYAHTLFSHSQFCPPEKSERVKLVKVTFAALGFGNPCSYQEVTSHAASLGLKLCPLSLGAFLRLEYLDQEVGPYLSIASKLPEEATEYQNGFYIRNHNHALWLRGYRADDFCEWPENNEWIFLK